MSKKTTTLADEIRSAFKRSGWPIQQLAIRAGVAYSAVHGFITGDRDITISTANRLCRTLGLELRATKKRKV